MKPLSARARRPMLLLYVRGRKRSDGSNPGPPAGTTRAMPSASSSNPVAIMLTLLPLTTRRLRHGYTRYEQVVAVLPGADHHRPVRTNVPAADPTLHPDAAIATVSLSRKRFRLPVTVCRKPSAGMILLIRTGTVWRSLDHPSRSSSTPAATSSTISATSGATLSRGANGRSCLRPSTSTDAVRVSRLTVHRCRSARVPPRTIAPWRSIEKVRRNGRHSGPSIRPSFQLAIASSSAPARLGHTAARSAMSAAASSMGPGPAVARNRRRASRSRDIWNVPFLLVRPSTRSRLFCAPRRRPSGATMRSASRSAAGAETRDHSRWSWRSSYREHDPAIVWGPRPVMWALHFILPGGAILPTVRSSIADEEHPDEIRDPSQRGWQVLVEGRGQQQRDHGCLPDDGAEAVVPRLNRHGAARGREGGDSRQDRRAQQLTPARTRSLHLSEARTQIATCTATGPCGAWDWPPPVDPACCRGFTTTQPW